MTLGDLTEAVTRDPMTNFVTFLGVAGLYFLGLNVYFQLKKNYGQSNLLEPVRVFVSPCCIVRISTQLMAPLLIVVSRGVSPYAVPVPLRLLASVMNVYLCFYKYAAAQPSVRA
jgi:hypothetical protein